MTETEGGAALAWRLLATLEGGSLLLAASALLAYTTRAKVTARQPTKRTIKQVLITNIKNDLGRNLEKQLELYGCVVSTMTEDMASYGVGRTEAEIPKVDALVVIGADPNADGLDNLADLVTQDIHENMKLLESLSSLVRRGGSLCWACVGSSAGVFRAAATAFDDVLYANLQHVATNAHCEAVWVGRCSDAELAAERVAAALLHCDHTRAVGSSSFRYAAEKVFQYFGGWLKKMA